MHPGLSTVTRYTVSERYSLKLTSGFLGYMLIYYGTSVDTVVVLVVRK